MRQVLGGVGGRAVKVLDLATDLGLFVSMAALVGLGVLIPVDVISRQVFGSPLPFAIPYGEILLGISIALSFAYTEKIGDHVAVELSEGVLPESFARISYRIGIVISLIVLAVIVYSTTMVALASWRQGEQRIGLVDAPLWPGRVAVALGFLLLTAQVARRLASSKESGDVPTG